MFFALRFQYCLISYFTPIVYVKGYLFIFVVRNKMFFVFFFVRFYGQIVTGIHFLTVKLKLLDHAQYTKVQRTEMVLYLQS